jgi:hypothetical protein
MAMTYKPDFYLGVITGFKEGCEKEEHIITADIPGIATDIEAYPLGNAADEPKINDNVILICLDPIYQSYYVYIKLKESNFIGYRSSGKMIDITPDSVTIGIFDPETEYKDNERPETTSSIVIDKDNNITITGANISITVEDGNCDVKADKCNVSASDCTVEADNVNIKGVTKIEGDTIDLKGVTTIDGNTTIKGGMLQANGTAAPTGSGPFCGIPVCPFTGAPHVGNIVQGN